MKIIILCYNRNEINDSLKLLNDIKSSADNGLDYKEVLSEKFKDLENIINKKLEQEFVEQQLIKQKEEFQKLVNNKIHSLENKLIRRMNISLISITVGSFIVNQLISGNISRDTIEKVLEGVFSL